MAKLHSKPKPKGRWSEETIRRRGVRAVVAALRLNKEYQQLSLEHACHLEETRLLKKYLKQIGSLNRSLRNLVKMQNKQSASNSGNGNSWMTSCDSQAVNGSPRKKE
jgi:hypothetical protein